MGLLYITGVAVTSGNIPLKKARVSYPLD